MLQHRPFINGKVEEKTAGDGPSLATMFEDDRHLQGIIQSIKVRGFNIYEWWKKKMEIFAHDILDDK